ncbi:MAG: hypothetical protein WCG87_07450, partial [Bacteroidota bacterium]
MKKYYSIIILIVFLLLASFFYLLKAQRPEFDMMLLQVGNIVVAALSLVTFLIVSQKMDGRPEAFVRGKNAASFLKILVCMFAMLIYLVMNREHIHKASVF